MDMLLLRRLMAAVDDNIPQVCFSGCNNGSTSFWPLRVVRESRLKH